KCTGFVQSRCQSYHNQIVKGRRESPSPTAGTATRLSLWTEAEIVSHQHPKTSVAHDLGLRPSRHKPENWQGVEYTARRRRLSNGNFSGRRISFAKRVTRTGPGKDCPRIQGIIAARSPPTTLELSAIFYGNEPRPVRNPHQYFDLSA